MGSWRVRSMHSAFAAAIIWLGLAGSGAQAAECKCENLKALQNELKIALLLHGKFAAKAEAMRAAYGENPKGSDLSAARRDYESFAGPPAPGVQPAAGSARDGLPRATPGAPGQIAFVPRGAELRRQHANDERTGITEAIKVTPIGEYIPDVDRRRAIEQDFVRRRQDLCDHQDEAAVKASMAAGSVCAGIANALRIHEDTHQRTCRRMGFYAFNERGPVQLLDDEVLAYKAQIDALANEIRRILRQARTRITSGAAGADAASLLTIETRCAVAFTVAGNVDDLRFADKVCDAATAFTVKTSPNANFRFTPSSETRGTYAYSGQAGGGHFFGNGGYVVDLSQGKGSLILDGAGRWQVRHPLGVSSKGGPERLRITELPEGCS